MAARAPMMSLRPARRFDWSNLRVRVASAAVLLPAVGLAVIVGHWVVLLLVAVAVALLAVEWAQMSAPATPIRNAVVVTLGVLLALFIGYRLGFRFSWPVLAVGAAGAALAVRGSAIRAGDAAFGVLYIGVAAIALVWLRESPLGLAWTALVLAVTWASDIAAFAVGSVVKGPKLWPRFSPNKTWSGFIGGLVAAVLAAAGVAAGLHLGVSFGTAAAIGLAGGLATMAGDLWESMLKRRFGVKDSGDLIPGHGGLLDRVDGLLFSVTVIAAARLAVQMEWLR